MMNSNTLSSPLHTNEHIVLSTRLGRNATVLRQALESQGLVCMSAPTVQGVVDAIQTNAALVVVTEEVLATAQRVEALIQCLNNQPEWSDIPVIVLLKDCRRFPSCMAFLRQARFQGNLVLLEMPIKQHEFISVVQSCLQHRQRQYALRDTLERLQESNRILENFSHMVAHELRNPLGNIVSSLGYLVSRNALEGKQQELLNIGWRSAKNLNQTIQALLDYGKLNVQDSLALESTDMNQVVQQAVANMQQVIETHQAKVDWDNLPVVQGNEPLLTQLVSNLVKNAIVHNTDSLPEVHISAELHSDKWQFYFSDNGPGIALEDQQKIFALFERTRKSSAAGSGIGLALCRRIVELHRGTISVHSELGQGSTFYFELSPS